MRDSVGDWNQLVFNSQIQKKRNREKNSRKKKNLDWITTGGTLFIEE